MTAPDPDFNNSATMEQPVTIDVPLQVLHDLFEPFEIGIQNHTSNLSARTFWALGEFRNVVKNTIAVLEQNLVQKEAGFLSKKLGEVVASFKGAPRPSNISRAQKKEDPRQLNDCKRLSEIISGITTQLKSGLKSGRNINIEVSAEDFDFVEQMIPSLYELQTEYFKNLDTVNTLNTVITNFGRLKIRGDGKALCPTIRQESCSQSDEKMGILPCPRSGGGCGAGVPQLSS